MDLFEAYTLAKTGSKVAKKVTRKTKRTIKNLILLLILAVSIFVGHGIYSGNIKSVSDLTSSFTNAKTDIENTVDTVKNAVTPRESRDNKGDRVINPVSADGKLEVHFIDVGQGDSLLVRTGDKSMLIDTGTYDYKDKLEDYLRGFGIDKLDIAIATHPHADHIGSMANIINEFKPDKVLLPDAITTTTAYEKMLDAIAANSKAEFVKEGYTFTLGEANITIVAPYDGEYDDLNEYSVVCRLDYGNTSFLLTGDCESSEEEKILAAGYDIDCDVLKVGHHGSDTSTSKEFLQAVSPNIAVIEVGAGNDYGHPTDEVLNRLKAAGCEDIYRTDINGTIVATTDGTSIDWHTEK